MNMTNNKARSAIRQLGFASLAATAVFIISMLVCTFLSAGQLEIELPEGSRAEYFRPETGIVEIHPAPENERLMIVTAKGRGKEFINYHPPENVTDPQSSFEYVKVLPGGVIFNVLNGDFSGCRSLTLIVQIYLLVITSLLTMSFVIRCEKELFSYSTLFFGGTTLFLMSLILYLLIGSSREFTMKHIYSMLKNAGSIFVTLLMPIMVIFAVSLAVSNVSLIRREGRSFVNLLGLILSGLIIAGYVAAIIFSNIMNSGSEQQVRIYDTFRSVYFTTFAYFEAMLISACACGIIAAKGKSSYDKTHIIILGCAIADDGTPLPLLKGRIDKAIAFANEQKAKSGKTVKFVPSGGQGSDEVISEAESMKNYLLAQGIDENSIILENKSTTTQENMRLSLEKITADCAEPSIVFSTSGYHVLRSGIISRNEGLVADGIGSKVKWYFFPNAFIREFVGLLVSKWKQHLFWTAFFILLFMAVNILMPM